MSGKRNQAAPAGLLEASRPYRWQKGTSGNPAGRPPNIKTLTVILRNQLSEPAYIVEFARSKAMEYGLEPALTSIGAVLSLAMIERAIEGDAVLIKEIINRVDGKVSDMVELNLSGVQNALGLKELEAKVRKLLANVKEDNDGESSN